jgi:isoquinoline 1-oxidoreductase beta subunit
VVSHAASKKQAKFGALAAEAAKLPVPQDVKLKDAAQFTLIGKSAPRLDSVGKTDGSARFTLDVKMPGMLTAMLVQPPAFGATVKSFDGAAAKAVKGVVDVVQTPHGVAVVGENTWAAMKGREALTVEWDFAKADTRTSAQMLTEYNALLAKPGASAEKKGDAAAALAAAKTKLEAEYSFPYLAHAALEPMNCIAQITAEGCTITTGAQFQTVDQMVVGKALGIEPAQVKINTLISGGSFGRRAVPDSDYIIQTVEIAKALKTDKPVKLVWTREDDMRAGRYRPMVAHKVAVGLDAAGAISAWNHHVVGQSILAGTPFAQFAVQNGVDGSLVEGAAKADYPFPNVSVDCTLAQSPITVLWWRSVGHTHTAYVVETMVDEAAKTAGQDPLAYRRAMLAEKPRHLAVLDLLAEKSGWGSAPPSGVHRGVAIHESFRTVVGQVAEVEIVDNRLRVKRVVCVVDCGTAVNPDVVKAQMEGGIGFALSAALFSELTMGEGGRVEQTNFDSYRMLRMSEMPKIEVHILPSAAPPTGVGEPGVPPLAPAVANAIAAATGKRIRQLPFAKHFDV